MFKTLNRQLIYQDKYVAFYQDKVKFPREVTGSYTWVDRKSGVLIALLNAKKQILLNHEYRYVIGKYSWELPGGGIDTNETPLMAAIRELKEETGIQVSTCEAMGVFHPLNSFNTETITLFLAKTTESFPHKAGNEAGEAIAAQKFISLNIALQMIDQGEISDAMTALFIQLLKRRESSL